MQAKLYQLEAKIGQNKAEQNMEIAKVRFEMNQFCKDINDKLEAICTFLDIDLVEIKPERKRYKAILKTGD